MPGVAAAGAYVIAASMIGGVAFLPLLGAVIDTMEVRTVPLLLFLLAVVCGVLRLWLRRNAPDPGAPQPVTSGAEGQGVADSTWCSVTPSGSEEDVSKTRTTARSTATKE
ncbi:hypothetical protein [Streptomyces erythrochromogenes]|uniref:hypothetical protein n=1 Tax=Streptomyces erythrochromogenes TaxID=285574 RepID=UPI0037F40ECA